MSKTWIESLYPDQNPLGLDEAGRGPLAGPCVVAGVILPLGYAHPIINDSKQLSEKQRESAFIDILRDALWVMVVCVLPETIDRLNIYQATKQAMMTIGRSAPTSLVLTDAMPFALEGKTVLDFIKGDSRSISIAAASIVAKVTRDHIMFRYDREYPEYGFKQHKGYPTKAHIQALNRYGITPIHRLSYAPVRELIQPNLFNQE